MRPTQKDIARLAHVSQATVSLVLNGAAAGSVPEPTCRRVLEAAARVGYVPNRIAQSLRSSQTRTLACVVPDIANPFYPALARGAQEAAEKDGYDLLIYNTDGVAEKERKCLEGLRQGRVDGFLGVFFHLRAPDFWPLLKHGIAVVRIEAGPKEAGPWPLDNLFVDHRAAAHLAAQHLIRAGRRRIAMIAGEAGPHRARVAGYRQALAEAKLPVKLTTTKDYSEREAHAACTALLRAKTKPDAVIAGNDVMAVGTLTAARERGLQVPGDLAVIGFDDIPLARLIHPALTTVSQFQQDLGRRAVELLTERLGPARGQPGRSEEGRFELIVRESA